MTATNFFALDQYGDGAGGANQTTTLLIKN